MSIYVRFILPAACLTVVGTIVADQLNGPSSLEIPTTTKKSIVGPVAQKLSDKPSIGSSYAGKKDNKSDGHLPIIKTLNPGLFSATDSELGLYVQSVISR